MARQVGREARSPCRSPPLCLLAAGSVALQPAAAGRTAKPSTGIVRAGEDAIDVWTPDNNNTIRVKGTVVVNGRPVSGVRVRVDNYDVTTPHRTARGSSPTSSTTRCCSATSSPSPMHPRGRRADSRSPRRTGRAHRGQASINVAYAVRDLKVSRNGAGQPVVTGRLAKTNAAPPPAVGLLTYQLKGTVTDADGKPVAGAQLSTRTLDRDYWTVSTETDRQRSLRLALHCLGGGARQPGAVHRARVEGRRPSTSSARRSSSTSSG